MGGGGSPLCCEHPGKTRDLGLWARHSGRRRDSGRSPGTESMRDIAGTKCSTAGELEEKTLWEHSYTCSFQKQKKRKDGVGDKTGQERSWRRARAAALSGFPWSPGLPGRALAPSGWALPCGTEYWALGFCCLAFLWMLLFHRALTGLVLPASCPAEIAGLARHGESHSPGTASPRDRVLRKRACPGR